MIEAVVLTDEFASLLAVSVHVTAVPGAVHVVFTPLAVCAELNVPQVAVQSTNVSIAFETVAFAVAVYPTLTLLALFVIAEIVTVCGATVTELSRKLPAALEARSQYVVAVVKAAVAIGVLLVGELEISLPPCAVPTSAETALLN